MYYLWGGKSPEDMKLFQNETWKSFWPNFLAVILGILITFGGERLVTDYQKRQDAREIVKLFKTDVERHLEISAGLIDDYTARVSALRQCAVAYDGKELGKVSADTLRYALGFFFSARGDIYSPVGMKILEVSGALGAVHEPEVVEAVTKIGNVITAFWRQHDRMTANIIGAKQHLYEGGRLDWRYRGTSQHDMLEYRFRCLMEDTLCAGLVTRGSVPAYLKLFRKMNENIRAELDIVLKAGY